MAPFERIGEHNNPYVSGSIGIDRPRIDSGPRSGEVQGAQQKLKFALVDSGMGGGMTAAHLRGEVRQLGSYFCLPIGEKQPNIATAYTAAMALWPLIAPLSNSNGENDGRIAEKVIIACNSASVRKEGAVELMKQFCKGVADGGLEKDGLKLNDQIRANILALHAKLEESGDYLEKNVHEIVSETAKTGVAKAMQKMTDNSVFIRIDSTNGTVESGAYLTNIENELATRAKDGVVSQSYEKKSSDAKTDPHIKLNVYTYVDHTNHEQKTVIVENRGDPLWVPDIEGNKIGETGATLAANASAASQEAIEKALKEFGSQVSSQVRDKLRTNTPDVSMLCCTHYPAMKEALEGEYNKLRGGVEFLNQATIVRDLVAGIDPSAVNPESGPLDLALTIGSQNYGGTPGNLKPSIANGDATATTLFNVLDTTSGGSRPDSGLNDWLKIGSVKVFQQGSPGEPDKVNPKDISSLETKGVLQQQFELIHQFIGKPFEARILGEQGLKRAPDGSLERITNPANEIEKRGVANFPVAGPRIDLNSDAGIIYANLSGSEVAGKLDKLGVLTTKGEARGIDKLALFNDQGAQLRATVARIAAVKARNGNLDEGAMPERVGILTGFSVIDNDTLGRVGGENDGPPGAVIMARTLLLQGLPVTMVTDHSNEASLVSALIGAGLATLNVVGNQAMPQRRTLDGIDIVTEIDGQPLQPGQLKFEVPMPREQDSRSLRAFGELPRVTGGDREEFLRHYNAAVKDTVGKLKKSNVTTMISIERPSITQSDGGSYSMLGLDVSSFNLDMSPMLGNDDSEYKPFTIGIGDGGNELGTGGVQKITAGGRDGTLQPFVKRGDFIAARKDLATDVMLLSTVSNNGGITISMAIDLGLESLVDSNAVVGKKADQRLLLEKRFDSTIEAYNGIIGSMYREGMSLDGVNKENQLTVDGRRLGSVEQALERRRAHGGETPLGRSPTGGADTDTTHNDTFLQFKHTLLGS